MLQAPAALFTPSFYQRELLNGRLGGPLHVSPKESVHPGLITRTLLSARSGGRNRLKSGLIHDEVLHH